MKLNPYAWIAVAVILFSLVWGIWLHGRAKGVDSMRDKVAAKDAALNVAATALRASRTAILEINAEADKRIQLAADQAKAATDAAKVLDAENDALSKRARDDEARWAKAKNNPDCKALLKSDLTKICGVSVR